MPDDVICSSEVQSLPLIENHLQYRLRGLRLDHKCCNPLFCTYSIGSGLWGRLFGLWGWLFFQEFVVTNTEQWNRVITGCQVQVLPGFLRGRDFRLFPNVWGFGILWLYPSRENGEPRIASGTQVLEEFRMEVVIARSGTCHYVIQDGDNHCGLKWCSLTILVPAFLLYWLQLSSFSLFFRMSYP